MNRILRCLLVLSLCLTAAVAQDEASKPAPQAVTTAQLDIPVEHLKLRLGPLTVQELEVEATAWRGLVKKKAEEVATAAIASRTAEAGSEAKKNELAKLESATKSQGALLERFGAILEAWEAKGGDPAEFRRYAAALGGAKIDLKDPGTATNALVSWLKSPEGGIKWAVKLAIFVAILIAFRILSALVSNVLKKAMERHKASSELLDRFVHNLGRRFIMAIGLLVGLSTLGINVGALLALIGGGAFIFAFALQDTLSNFANGLMLLIYQPFDVGDAVELGGVSGKVDSVTLVNTKIRTFDNKLVLVPNKDVWGQTITNATASGTRRVDMVFGIGYDDDSEKAQALLEKIVAEHELVMDDPAPTIQMNELGDSAVNFICRPWSKTSDYWAVYWDITKRVKKEFEANGLSFPYPQQDVHLHQAG